MDDKVEKQIDLSKGVKKEVWITIVVPKTRVINFRCYVSVQC